MDFKSEKVSRSSDTDLGGSNHPNSFSISEIAPYDARRSLNEEQSSATKLH